MQKKMKSVLCLLLCALMALALPVTALAAYLGDVDGNGKVETKDARLALRAAIGLEQYAVGSARFTAADWDGNGKIETRDARMVLRAAIGLEKLKETGCEHEWKLEKASATVTGDKIGIHTMKCAKCGATKEENCTYPDTWKARGDLLEPTCTKDANVYRECTVCAGKQAKTLAKLNHSAKKKVAAKSKAANCTEAGWDWYECPLCGKNGDTLKELKVAVPALGHAPSSAADPINSDIVCERCHKTITPAFNTLVNAINMSATPRIYFSKLTKTDSSGALKKDAKGNDMYNIHIPDAAKTLMRLAGESLDEATILEQFTSELNATESTYTNYIWNSPYLTKYYPIPESETVSALTKDDVTGINIQEINNIDFVEELPDSVLLQLGGSSSRSQDLANFKALGGATGNIYKITVTLKEEKYTSIKDSAQETALQHATGEDIRKFHDQFTQEDNENGFELKMSCSEVVSNCAITYYFLVTGDDTKVYTPLGSRYVTKFDIDQHIELKAGMPISELGIDSGILNLFLATTGLKQGDDLVFMEGTIDLIVNNTNTDYYLFTTDPVY